MNNKIFNWSRKMRDKNAVNSVLLIVLIASFAYNQTLIASTRKSLGMGQAGLSKIIESAKKSITKNTGADSENSLGLTGDISQDSIKLAISSGAPGHYGEELGVSFDFNQVPQSMNIMAKFDPDYGKEKIVLTGDDLKRYIDIALRISCEFCCGAKAIIFENGEAACGCAHSQAMRGLAAYLIKNHGEHFSNDEILRELAKWKAMYYPKQMIQKTAKQISEGKYTPDISALVLDVKLPDYGKGSGSAPLPSEIKDLPSMVGGC